MEIARMANALSKSWSVESSTKWSRDNPSVGRCGVTALVVNELLGGEIKKTKLRYDFTASQFREGILYIDITSNRDEEFEDTNEGQYSYLKQ